MPLTDAYSLTFAIAALTQISTIAFLVWLYRSTRVKPVLYNAIWHTAGIVWTPAQQYLNSKTMAWDLRHLPVLNPYVFVVSQVVGIVGVALLIWMLAALFQWGKTRQIGNYR